MISMGVSEWFACRVIGRSRRALTAYSGYVLLSVAAAHLRPRVPSLSDI